MAPSTLGTFLRAFTFGHVRQLDHVLDQTIARAWDAGAGPGDGPLVIDIDSHASRAIDFFVAEFEPKWPKAAGKLTKDRDALLAFL